MTVGVNPLLLLKFPPKPNLFILDADKHQNNS